MKKTTKQFFARRYRLIIGYIGLLVAFFCVLIFLPKVAPGGLSSAEMQSAIKSSNISTDFIQQGNIIDLPYHLLQKLSLNLFGLNLISIKLPSIIIGVFTALLIVLLINRWFKSDVAIFGSVLTVLSAAFLFLATSGTPTIMYIFWLSLLLWLGSKIVGNKNVSPILVVSFFLAVSASLYTPHLIYVAITIAIAGLLHPHLRFALKQIKPIQVILSFAIFVIIALPLVVSCVMQPSVIKDILFAPNFDFGSYFTNISESFAPFFSFGIAYDSVYLSPLFNLATIALIFIGILASMGELFTSRNTVISLLVIFAIVFSGLNKDIAILVIIPVAILSAAGIESIFKKWHSLFPENPYARFIGTVPMLVVVLLIILPSFSHFVEGYHYTPNVAKNFNNDIELINKFDSGSILVVSETQDNRDFYKLFERYNSITVVDKMPERTPNRIIYLSNICDDERFALKQIITSPKSRNSDRLYIYEKIPTNQGEE